MMLYNFPLGNDLLGYHLTWNSVCQLFQCGMMFAYKQKMGIQLEAIKGDPFLAQFNT